MPTFSLVPGCLWYFPALDMFQGGEASISLGSTAAWLCYLHLHIRTHPRNCIVSLAPAAKRYTGKKLKSWDMRILDGLLWIIMDLVGCISYTALELLCLYLFVHFSEAATSQTPKAGRGRSNSGSCWSWHTWCWYHIAFVVIHKTCVLQITAAY